MLLEKNGVTVTKTSANDISHFKAAGYKEVKPVKAAKPKKDTKLKNVELPDVNPEELTEKQLHAIAKDLGMKGYKKLEKPELIDAISEAYEELEKEGE